MNSLLSDSLVYARRLVDAGRVQEALQAYHNLLQAHPDSADAWYEYAWLLRRSGSPEQALQAYARALSAGIGGAEEVHLNRAVILSEDLRKPEDAATELGRALNLNPDYPAALLNLGKLHEDLGDWRSAASAYLRLSAQNTAPALALEALARLVQIQLPSEALPERLQRLRTAAGDPRHSTELRAGLLFALGRCHEALRAHTDAFECFIRANGLAALGGPAYSPAAIEHHVDAILSAPTSLTGGLPAATSDETSPLFICGMFRSGSTLLEQALNGHPDVFAGGELPFFPRLAAGPLAEHVTGKALPTALAERLRADYRSLLKRIAGTHVGTPRFITDKRPDNILLLALIRQLFPRARIIITRRDPMDTGLSVFQQHLSQTQAPYSSSLAAIGHYQTQVDRLVDHAVATGSPWVRVFDYDAFVRTPEPELRGLLDWLQLSWEPDCLLFHEQRNAVATASYAQVRRPLYRESSGRWRVYSEQLVPLARALEHADKSGTRPST